MPIKNEALGADYREPVAETVLVLSYNGQEDTSAAELIKALRKGSTIEYMSPEALPIKPPPGVQEVLLSSGNDIVFLNKEHQQNWSGISFKKLMHPPGGAMAHFSKEQESMESKDFKVAGE